MKTLSEFMKGIYPVSDEFDLFLCEYFGEM